MECTSYLQAMEKMKMSGRKSQHTAHRKPLGIDYAMIFVVVMYFISLLLELWINK